MNIGKTLIIVGIILFILGIVFTYFKSSFGWFGTLFGDISYKSDKFQFFMPLTSMIIISIFLTITLNVILKYFGK